MRRLLPSTPRSRSCAFDDGFALLGPAATFALAGGGLRIAVDLLEGYPYAQVFAPKGEAFVALEPMTAPTNALVSGQGLRLVGPGEALRATFRVRVEPDGRPVVASAGP